MPKHRSPEEREAAMTVLQANGGNIKKTARETGIDPKTLREWRDRGEDTPPPEKSQVLIESYLDKARRAREMLLDRMIQVAQNERDLFKLSGAFKIVADATSDEEVNRALANRINAAQAPAPAGVQDPRIAGGADPAIN